MAAVTISVGRTHVHSIYICCIHICSIYVLCVYSIYCMRLYEMYIYIHLMRNVSLPGVSRLGQPMLCSRMIDCLFPFSPQDTNILEYEVLKRLRGADCQLFVVGDPNQAIYMWRGALTEHLDARFKADFGHCTSLHHLKHNHRCGTHTGACRHHVYCEQSARRLAKCHVRHSAL